MVTGRADVNDETCAYCDQPLAEGEAEYHAACMEADAEQQAELDAWKKEMEDAEYYPNHRR